MYGVPELGVANTKATPSEHGIGIDRAKVPVLRRRI
jgi:hypothetical protein